MTATPVQWSAQLTGQPPVTNALPVGTAIGDRFSMRASVGGPLPAPLALASTEVQLTRDRYEVDLLLEQEAIVIAAGGGGAQMDLHEFLVTLTPLGTVDASLVLAWSGAVFSNGALTAEIDAFDDGVVEVTGTATSGAQSVTMPLPTTGGAVRIRIRTALSAQTLDTANVQSAFRIRVLPVTRATDRDGCWVRSPTLGSQPRLDGGVDFNLLTVPYRPGQQIGTVFVVLGPTLPTPLPVPSPIGVSCTLDVVPLYVVATTPSIPITTVAVGGDVPAALRPFSIDAQGARFDPMLQWVETTGRTTIVFP